MGYGVMVTLQILVLSFLVRARVPQQRVSLIRGCFFLCRDIIRLRMSSKLFVFHWIVAAFCACTTTTAFAQDSTHVVRLDEVEVVSSVKEVGTMKQQPVSVTLIRQQDLENHHITSLKEIGASAPNFYMPDYGSRLTSAVYIRGIGSRINNPSVGLYVDDIPYVDKRFRFQIL